MAATYKLITSNILASTATSVTFSSIPSTYTDLVLKTSIRTNVAGAIAVDPSLLINGNSSAIYSQTYLQGNGATVAGARSSGQTEAGFRFGANDTGSTANTFTSSEFYFPSYRASHNKPFSLITATENNATTGYINAQAQLFGSTSAITSISITIGAGAYSFAAGSSFRLYGISNE